MWEDVLACHPMLVQLGDLALLLLLRQSPWIVVGFNPPRLAAPDQQRTRPVGIGGCKKARHRRTFGRPENGRALASNGVHYGPDVVGTLLQRGDVAWPIRKPRAALVKPDEPAEGRKGFEEVGPGRPLPLHVELGDRARGINEIDGTGARDLISDLEVAAAPVLNRRSHVRPP